VTELDGGEVALSPVEVRRELARRREHLVIDVHADDIDAVACELNRDPSRAAPGVENARG